MSGQAKDEQSVLRATEAVAVLAEMERHAPLPSPVAYYAIKLRMALGVEGELTCTCGTCRSRA